MKIAIIGCGNLGKRYLETLSYIKLHLSIFLVEPNEQNLQSCLLNYENFNQNNHIIISCSECEDILKYTNELDIVIVSTCADVRRTMIEQIVNIVSVKFMILEKILFQHINDYFFINKLFIDKKIQAWVNCPRRTFNFYKYIKNKLDEKSIGNIHLSVNGANWQMLSNSIHFIDLYMYLNNYDLSSNIGLNGYDLNIVNSFRQNYHEIIGTIKSNDGKLQLTSNLKNNSQSYLIKKIWDNDKLDIEIVNDGEYVKIIDKNNFIFEKNLEFKIPLLSSYMHVHISNILKCQTCCLTTFEQSMYYHLLFLNFIYKYFNNKNIRIT
jgi:hypothetical protein